MFIDELPYKDITLIETKEERERHDHLTDHTTPYKVMNGLAGLSLFTEGYLRLDRSNLDSKEKIFLKFEYLI